MKKVTEARKNRFDGLKTGDDVANYKTKFEKELLVKPVQFFRNHRSSNSN